MRPVSNLTINDTLSVFGVKVIHIYSLKINICSALSMCS